MIVKDEERRLSRCLTSVAGISPEIIVVDTGSSDATVSIAASYGATVTRYDFTTIDFAAARNWGIALATRPWIFVLDADETVDAESLPWIQEIAGGGENVGYYVERTNHRSESGEATTDFVVRLFPNRKEYRYHGRVHETIDQSILAGGGRLLRSPIRIEHDFASSPAARRRKNLWYINILKEELARDPNDCSRLTFLAAEYHQLEMFDQATEIAERIASLQPLDPEAHLNAGIYHLCYKGDRNRARADFMEALRLRPSYPEAVSFLELTESDEMLPNS